MTMKKILCIIVTVFILSAIQANDRFQEEFQVMQEYLSFHDVLVISASKRIQNLIEAPVSMTVITNEDIKMSGVQSIAEVLRMAPGVYVQETSGGQQDVAIRGMINVPKQAGAFAAFSRNILVLIDGRSHFNDVFGGTFWEFIPVTIADIDRIEIVHGPASALYGANAVTGVINIITKKTDNTKGALISSSFGSKGRNIHSLRYGNINKNLSFRISGEITEKKAFDNFSYDHSKQIYEYRYSVLAADGEPNPDYLPPYEKSLDAYRLSSFFNYDLKEYGELELQLGYSNGKYNSNGTSGDLFLMGYKNHENYVGRLTYSHNNLKFTVSDNYGLVGTEYKKSKIYKEERDSVTGDTILALDDYVGNPQNGILWNSLDFEIQNIFELGYRNKLVAGANYRVTKARSDAQYFRATSDNKQTFQAAFFNNEYMINENLKWILGGRFDKYNKPDNTSFSPQSIILFTPDNDQSIRFIYSKAIRAPFIADLMMDLQFSNGFTQDEKWAPLLKLSPNFELDPMTIESYEIGYSKIFNDNLNMNLNLYHYNAKDLIGYDITASDSPYAVATHLFKETSAAGDLKSINLDGKFKSNGAEFGFNYIFDRYSKIWGSYAYQNSKFNNTESKASPEHLLSVGLNRKFKNNGVSVSASVNYTSDYTVSLTNVMDHTLYNTLVEAGTDYSLIANRYDNNIYNAYITTGAEAYEQMGGNVIVGAAAGMGLLAPLLTDTEATFLGFSTQNPDMIAAYKSNLLQFVDEPIANMIIHSDTVAAGKSARAGFGSAFVTSAENVSTQTNDALLFLNFRIAKSIFNNNGEVAFFASLRPSKRQYPFGEKTGSFYRTSLSYTF